MEQVKKVYYSAREAAVFLGLHPVYVRILLREKKIKGFKNGNWRISKEALIAYAEGR